MITAMRKAFKTDEDQTFIFACNIETDSRATSLHEYALKYDGKLTENEWTYIFKADIDPDLMSVTLQDRSTTAVLLKDEIVWSVYEYAPNCMLISLNNTSDLLLILNLKETKIIPDPETKNYFKYWIAPFPGFNLERFPFLITAGEKNFSLINVNEGRIEKLINATSYPDASMEGAVFRRDGTSTHMNFATFLTRADNPDLVCFQWNKFSFHLDFLSTLTELGGLPDLSLRNHLNLHKELKLLKMANERAERNSVTTSNSNFKELAFEAKLSIQLEERDGIIIDKDNELMIRDIALKERD